VHKGDNVVQYRRRMTEVGQRGASATRDTYRFLVGLEGDVAEDHHWQTYFGYGRMDDAQQGGGQINVLNMREALQRTYVATPGPKWVIAVGDCAINGGIFAGSYAVADGIADAVPVDLTIEGCPPSPEQLLVGLLTLLEVS